jgi:hypothetical protein
VVNPLLAFAAVPDEAKLMQCSVAACRTRAPSEPIPFQRTGKEQSERLALPQSLGPVPRHRSESPLSKSFPTDHDSLRSGPASQDQKPA